MTGFLSFPVGLLYRRRGTFTYIPLGRFIRLE